MEVYKLTQEIIMDPRVVEHGVYRLCAGVRKFQLKSEICEMFTTDDRTVKIEPHLYESYLRTCENAIRQISGISKDDMVRKLTVSLFDWMSEEGSGIKDRAYVASEIRTLHGLDKIGVGDEEVAKKVRDFVTNARKIPEPESDVG